MAHVIDERCNGCSACARQCPVQAIDGVFREQYRVDGALCIDCGVCGWICPKTAVVDERGRRVQRLRRDQRPRPVVDVDLCNGCALCLDLCPFDCRALVGRVHAGISYLALPDRCVACGECERICDKRAIICKPLDLRAYDPATQVQQLKDHHEL